MCTANKTAHSSVITSPKPIVMPPDWTDTSQIPTKASTARDIEHRWTSVGDDPPQEGDNHAIRRRQKRVDAWSGVFQANGLRPERQEIGKAEHRAGKHHLAAERLANTLPKNGSQHDARKQEAEPQQPRCGRTATTPFMDTKL